MKLQTGSSEDCRKTQKGAATIIRRRNKQPHRPQRRTTAASTPTACNRSQGRSEAERDSHPNNKTSTTTAAATTKLTTNTVTTTPSTTTTTTSMPQTHRLFCTSWSEKHSAKRSRVVVPHIWLVAMAGISQHVQRLLEIAMKDSRPAVQKTVVKIKRSGTILRRNQKIHRPQRRTPAAPTPIACNHSQGRSEAERDSHPKNSTSTITAAETTTATTMTTNAVTRKTPTTTTTTTSMTQTHQLFCTWSQKHSAERSRVVVPRGWLVALAGGDGWH